MNQQGDVSNASARGDLIELQFVIAGNGLPTKDKPCALR